MHQSIQPWKPAYHIPEQGGVWGERKEDGRIIRLPRSLRGLKKLFGVPHGRQRVPEKIRKEPHIRHSPQLIASGETDTRFEFNTR